MKALKLFDATKKIRITPNKLDGRLKAMEQVSGFKPETDQHRKARYALFKNIAAYKQASEVFTDMVETPSEKIQEYNNARVKLAIECGGTPQQMPGGGVQVVNVKDLQDFQAGIKKLDMEYKKDLLEDEQRIQRNNQLSQMDIEDVPEPHKIPASYFPDSVDSSKLAAIRFMLSEEPDNKEPKAAERPE